MIVAQVQELPIKNVSLSKLILNNFRNNKNHVFDFYKNMVIIFGDNGIGKTNILEAISLLSKGRGIRGVSLDDMINNCSDNSDSFAIFSRINDHPNIENVGTSYNKKENKRIFKINEKIDNRSDLVETIHLTPQLCNILTDSKQLRRKFFDKITNSIDVNHNSRINSYEKLLRERMNLMEKYKNQQEEWLRIIERKIAELGSAIAISRNEAVNYINSAISLSKSNFVKARIKIIGEIEELSLNNKSLFVEEYYLKKLQENRGLDLKSGRTSFGIHRSDFTASLLNKSGLEARFCSTGEQKSILIAITFARIKIMSLLNLPTPIVLLDEVISNLDNEKKEELFKEIANFDVQYFITGTCRSIFDNIKNLNNSNAQFVTF